MTGNPKVMVKSVILFDLNTNKTLALVAAVLAIVGLGVNAGVDLDNVYDMTTSGLFAVILILALASAFMGGMKSGSSMSAPSVTQQYKCNACGMSFDSQSALSDHASKNHGMNP